MEPDIVEIAESNERLWKWARRHRGLFMMGALLLVALVVPRSVTSQRTPDYDADETPLFI